MPDEADVVDLSEVSGEAPDPLPPREAWAAFEPLLWAYYLAHVRQQCSAALGDLEDRVRDGERPLPSEVRAARSALEQAEDLVDRYGELARGEA